MGLGTKLLMLGLLSFVIIACQQNDPAERAYRDSLTASAYNSRLNSIESELEGSHGINVDEPNNAQSTLAAKSVKSLTRIKFLLDEYLEYANQAVYYGNRPGVVVIGRQTMRNKIENAKAIRDEVEKRLTLNPPT